MALGAYPRGILAYPSCISGGGEGEGTADRVWETEEKADGRAGEKKKSLRGNTVG